MVTDGVSAVTVDVAAIPEPGERPSTVVTVNLEQPQQSIWRVVVVLDVYTVKTGSLAGVVDTVTEYVRVQPGVALSGATSTSLSSRFTTSPGICPCTGGGGVGTEHTVRVVLKGALAVVVPVIC